MKFVHTNIIAKDWKSLADFYIAVFDCKVAPPVRDLEGEWLEKGTGVKNAKLKGAHLWLLGYDQNGPTLEIYQYENIEDQEAIEPNRRGYGHTAFEVDDVEEVVRRVEQYGGQKFGEIAQKKIEGVGLLTFLYVRDPEGNLIEIQNWQKKSN